MTSLKDKSHGIRLPRHPRLIDVARAAGVSLGSASRTVNAPETVRPKTRMAVQAAVGRLGYIPNANGRALVSARSGTIGIVLPTISNMVFATFVQSLQKILAMNDYSLFVLSHEYSSDLEFRCIEQLIGRGVDGVVLIGTDHAHQTIALLRSRAIPHVSTWSIDEAPALNTIGICNRSAMKNVVRYLASTGHRRIAMLSGASTGNERVRLRLAGARESVDAHGMQITTVIESPLTLDGGRTGFTEWLGKNDSATALVCVADILAAGALDAAQLAGVSVPADLSITGFDDIDLAALIQPSLTTVRVPIEQMGTMAGETVIALISGRNDLATHALPTELIIRESTAAPANA